MDLEPVADAGDGLDRDAAAAEALGEVAEAGNDAIDGVVADHPPVPAARDQLVASDDPAGLEEGDEDLHDARLEGLAGIAAARLARRRVDVEMAEPERRLMRQDNLSRHRQTVVLRIPHAPNLTQMIKERQKGRFGRWAVSRPA